MQPVLIKIKRLIIAKKYSFTLKAEREMFADSLTEDQVLESILNANGIKKILRSPSLYRQASEKLSRVLPMMDCLSIRKAQLKKINKGRKHIIC